MKETLIKCPLCGFEFTKKEMGETKCTSCPLRKKCELLCCPNCRYQFVDETKIKNFLKFLKKEVKNETALPEKIRKRKNR